MVMSWLDSPTVPSPGRLVRKELMVKEEADSEAVDNIHEPGCLERAGLS